MIFPEKIISIHTHDKVLEIGPGATPYSRSDVFLELDFDSDENRLLQRGGIPEEADFGVKKVCYYDGNRFPFDDNEFDYVICSHVIEHVADPDSFLSEIFRVSKGRGYLEYPLITYEYLYNFNVHLHFVKFDFEQKTLRYLPKKNTVFNEFYPVHALFYNMLECGWDDLCSANKQLFFEGFEFNCRFTVERESDFKNIVPARSSVVTKSAVRRALSKIVDRLGL